MMASMTYHLRALLIMMVALICSCQTEPPPENRPPIENEMIVPGPWEEVFRRSNPSGTLDAILVQRPFGEDSTVTHLYIKPAGEIVENEPPLKPEYFIAYNRNSLRKACLVAYEASEMSFSWKDNVTLQVTGKTYYNSVHNCVRSGLHGDHEPVQLIFDLTNLGRNR